MAIAETAKLVASLELKDHFTPAANKALKSLGDLESRSFRVGQSIGKGMKNAAHNIARLGVVAGGVFAGAVVLGIRSLSDLQRTTAQTEAVIKSTGGSAKVSAAQVRSYAEALENVTTVDDKVIQDGENMLLTFTNIGGKVFPRATTAMVDMAVAMAKGDASSVDLKSTAIQLGKALNDPVKGITALRKVGVAFTEQQIKQIKAMVKSGDVVGAQTVILKELEKEFGKAGEAAGKGPAAVWRRLQDVGEDLSQALARGLLPVLEKVGTWLSTKLADPSVIRTLDDIGTELGKAADSAFEFIKGMDFKAIGAGLQVAAGAAKTIVSAFMAMPDWVKTAVIGGWGLNKLTGGALGDIVGELAKGAIKGVLGMNAGVVNIKAGVVNGGGMPGATGAAGKGLSGLSKVFLVGEAIGLAIAVDQVRQAIGAESTAHAQAIQDQTTKWLAQNPSRADLENGLMGVEQGINNLQANPLNVLVQGEALDKLRAMQAQIKGALSGTEGNKGKGKDDTASVAAFKAAAAALLARARAAGKSPSDKAIIATLARNRERQAADAAKAAAKAAEIKAQAQRTAAAVKDADSSIDSGANRTVGRIGSASQSNANQISGAIRANRPVITTKVNVYVTAAQVQTSTTTQQSYGAGTGSSGGGGNSGYVSDPK